MGIYGFPLVVNLIKVNEGEKETGINDLSSPGKPAHQAGLFEQEISLKIPFG